MLSVQHLYLVSRITLCSACGKKNPTKNTIGKHSKEAILNVNIDSCSLHLAFSESPFPLSKTLSSLGFHRSSFVGSITKIAAKKRFREC